MPTISAINSNILNLIGNTPLFNINLDNNSKIFAKLEKFNPFGSVKDRVAISLIEQAEKEEVLKKGDTIIEASSGNTAIGLASIALIKGYKMKVVLPEDASAERIKILQKLNADIVFISKEDWGKNAIEKVKILAKENNWKFLNQYENPANINAHRKTGIEIISQLNDEIPDFLVLGIGTGGTITGISTELKKVFPKIKIIGIMPKEKIEGIRDINVFTPKILNKDLIDEFVEVFTEDVEKSQDELVQKGILVGKSSSAAFSASKKIAIKFPGSRIVTLFPDGIEKYLSYI